MKKNASIAHLALYDIVGTPGVCADLSHINTPAKVTAHMGPNELSAALKDADVVVVPAGVPRKPGFFFRLFYHLGLPEDLHFEGRTTTLERGYRGIRRNKYPAFWR